LILVLTSSAGSARGRLGCECVTSDAELALGRCRRRELASAAGRTSDSESIVLILVLTSSAGSARSRLGCECGTSGAELALVLGRCCQLVLARLTSATCSLRIWRELASAAGQTSGSRSIVLILVLTSGAGSARGVRCYGCKANRTELTCVGRIKLVRTVRACFAWREYQCILVLVLTSGAGAARSSNFNLNCCTTPNNDQRSCRPTQFISNYEL
tara:strand:+ start:1794 stop:2438 length:645 start_codon:yes stop_codon:yes gene_type:complete